MQSVVRFTDDKQGRIKKYSKIQTHPVKSEKPISDDKISNS